MRELRGSDAARLVLHDYLQVNGGAERLVISLASGLPDFALGVSGLYPDFAGSGDLKGLVLHLPGRLVSCLPRIPRALLTFGRGGLVPRKADCVIYSGIYAPLAVHRQPGGKRIYYCHTPPRFAFDWEAQYMVRVPAMLRPLLRLAIPPCQGSCRVNRSNEGRLAGGQRVLYEEVFRRGSGAGGSADDAAA